jgi:hypothetical protein
LFRSGLGFAVGQGFGLERERLFERRVAAMAQLAFDVGGVTRLIGVLQN